MNDTSVMWKHEAYRGRKVRKEQKIVKGDTLFPTVKHLSFSFLNEDRVNVV